MKISSTITASKITVEVDQPIAREPLHAVALGAMAANLYDMGRSKEWILDYVRIAVERREASDDTATA